MLPLLVSVASAYLLAEKISFQNYAGLFLAMLGTFFFVPFLLLPGVFIPPVLPAVSTAAIIYLSLAVTILAYGLYNFSLSLMDAGKAVVY